MNGLLEGISIFFLVAIFSEAVWENIKQALPVQVPSVGDRLIVMIIAIYLCVQTGADITATANMGLPWPVGSIISGIICSRGANYLHDFVKSWGQSPTYVLEEIEE